MKVNYRPIKVLTNEVVSDEDGMVSEVHTHFGQRREDVREWLVQTSWVCQLSVDLEDLQGVIDTLRDVGVIDEPFPPERLVDWHPGDC